LVPQYLDPTAEIWLRIEEVETDACCVCDCPEVDVVALLDEAADSGFCAPDGMVVLVLGCLPECLDSAVGCGLTLSG
jgi:hypothetical protein